jgi:hypothetical protein
MKQVKRFYGSFKNKAAVAGAVSLGLMSSAHAVVTPPDVTEVVDYILAGMAAIALIGVAKMTISAAPAAYTALMGFIRR